MNWRKSRVARKSEECEVKIGEEIIEQVDTMKYLGVMISSDGSMDKEVEARIGNATRVIGRMNEMVLRWKELRKQEHQTKGSECHSDVHINVWLRDMKSVKAVAIKGTGHTNECFEEDQRSEETRYVGLGMWTLGRSYDRKVF